MRVLVAMSGGVDSAVAAYLLQKQGHEVVGMTLRVYDDPERIRRQKSCCAPMDIGDAREVAQKLNIPYYAIDMRQEFRNRVMIPFAKNYLSGKTPNPCVLCNQDLKFGLLHQRAQALGFEYVATGHYARCQKTDSNREVHLLKGRDRKKDQSYFLFSLNQMQLSHMLLPLGDLTKEEVRRLARKANLPVAEKPESQEICFVPDQQYARVVQETLPEMAQNNKEGSLVDERGNILGKHFGIHHFTVGQRKGLRISHKEPLYVLQINPETNQVVVGPQSSLGRREFLVEKVNWISSEFSSKHLSFEADVKIRYHHQATPAKLSVLPNDKVQVCFHKPQRAIAPGQAAVFYDGEEVLGGGWISA